MFLAGDEFGNTQFGNNNAYCQDNEISWLDWTRKEKFQDVFDFLCLYDGISETASVDHRRCRGEQSWISGDQLSR